MDKISSGVQDSWKYFPCSPRFYSRSCNAVVFYRAGDVYRYPGFVLVFLSQVSCVCVCQRQPRILHFVLLFMAR